MKVFISMKIEVKVGLLDNYQNIARFGDREKHN